MEPKKPTFHQDRKGQIHLTETIAVLFIFFVLLLLGMVFYYKYSQAALEDKKEELVAARAMDSTLKAIFLPELVCSRGKAEPEDNCFDMIKLRQADKVFKENLNQYYFNLFSYAHISVEEIYPGKNSWTIYDKPKPDFKKKEPTFFVVALKDDLKSPGTPYYRFGYLKVVVYS